MTLYARALSNTATLPHETEPNSNRYYIYSAEDKVMLANTRQQIRTDIEIRTPQNTIPMLIPFLSNWYESLDIGSHMSASNNGRPLWVPLMNNSKAAVPVFIGSIVAEMVFVQTAVYGPAIEFKKQPVVTESHPIDRHLK